MTQFSSKEEAEEYKDRSKPVGVTAIPAFGNPKMVAFYSGDKGKFLSFHGGTPQWTDRQAFKMSPGAAKAELPKILEAANATLSPNGWAFIYGYPKR